MQREEEDKAWQAIVQHYGDRVELDPEDELPAEDEATEPAATAPDFDEPDAPEDDTELAEAFVPPTPPPVPRPAPDRLLAWMGVFGAPVLLLLAAGARVDLPDIAVLLVVGGFVGGFLYLVFRMPREPRDPFDDGAQV